MSRSASRRGTAPLLAILAFTTGCTAAIGSAETPAPSAASTTVDVDARPICGGPATAHADAGVEPITDDPAQTLPVTVTDYAGREVTIADTSRILALDNYGTLASTVYALGLGDRLVGRDISTGIPELADLPVVTHNGHQLNGEAILALDPSVVLTDYSIGPLEVQLQLMDSDITVVVFSDQRSRAEIGPQIVAVSEALGVPDAGAALAGRVEAEARATETKVAALAPDDPEARLRMMFLYIRGNAGIYYSFGEGSGAGDLIEGLGGVDVSSEIGLDGMRPINAEGLVRADPDMFLMMTHGLESAGGIEGLSRVPGIADTGAASCVVDMDDHQILSFGPQYPATLDALAEAIYHGAWR